MRAFLYTCILGIAAVGFTGCQEENKFDPEPVILSTSFDLDTRNILIHFTDGDGNFGLEPADTLAPFNADNPDGTKNRFHFNLWVDLSVKAEGIWEPVETPGTFDFRILDLTPQGQNKQIDARVTYEMDQTLTDLEQPGFIAVGDTLQFSVQVVDRDLNVSPIMFTEPFVLN